MRQVCALLAGLLLAAGMLSADTVETIFLRADLSPANQVPPVTGVTASGRATIYLHVRRNDAGDVVSGVVDFDVDHSFDGAVSVTGLHIHNGAAGANGGIVIDSGIQSSNPVAAQGTGNILRSVEVTSGDALAAFKDMLVNPGNYYVNLHTTTQPAGLIRDQQRVAPPPPPSVSEGGMLNNAGYNLGSLAVAPGTIMAIFGGRLTDGTSCLAPTCSPEFGSDGKLKTTMAGSQVTVNGTAAPILYAVRSQLGVLMPYELTGTSATVRVTVAGQTSADRAVTIAPFSPGIFTTTADGRGRGAITHADGSLVTGQNPARLGETVILYATGLGQVAPAVSTGALPAGLTTTVTQPTVSIDGVNAQVAFAGLSGCCVGLNQLNVVIPAGAPSGPDLPVVLRAGGIASNVATIAVGQPSGSNPVPVITALSPNSIALDSDAQPLRIFGTGFMQSSTVTLNGFSKPATYVSDTQLTIAISPDDLTSQGNYPIIVTNPAPGGGSSSVANLRITAPTPDDPYDDDY
jgi:uncharacterized protein (TIGR03437 family)